MEKLVNKIEVTTITFTILPNPRKWWEVVFGLEPKKKIKFRHLISAKETLPLGKKYLGDNNIVYLSQDYRRDQNNSTILINVDKEWKPRATQIHTIIAISQTVKEQSNDQN